MSTIKKIISANKQVQHDNILHLVFYKQIVLNNIIIRSAYGLLLLLAVSCAQMASPEGGPKDVVAPQILKSSPENFSTQFKEKKIELTFDEYVLIKNPSQISISPLVENPKFNLKGKSIIIEFDSLLEENTTYTINFNNAIVDLNEGNILDSNVFVFSTGQVLDTLTFSGFVESAFEQIPVSDAFVFLYKNYEDSTPYKSKPYYLTKTSGGSFTIYNIKEGTYKAFALRDTNNNLMYDQPTESIAFNDTPIVIKENVTVNFRLFQEESKKQFIKSSKLVKQGHATIVFAKEVEDLQVTFLNGSEHIITEPHGKDSVSFWITDTIIDSLNVILSDGNNIIDTVELSVKKRTTATARVKGGISASKLTIAVNADSTRGLSPKDTLSLSFSHPVKTFDENKIILNEGTQPISFTSVYRDGIKKNLQLIFSTRKDSLYSLTIPDSTFTDILGFVNDSLKVIFKKQAEDFYGTLKLTLSIPEVPHQFIITLKEGKGAKTKVVILKKDRVATFKDLDPGNYTLTLIYDENNNGKWDTGDYLQRSQPEKVIRYTGQVTIRSNWEQELEWKVGDEESGRKLIKGQKER